MVIHDGSEPVQPIYCSGQKSINGRACSRLTCAVVATFAPGDTVKVLGSVQGDTVGGSALWYRVNADGTDVYIHSSLIAQKTKSLGQGTASSSQDAVSTAAWVPHQGTGMRIQSPAEWEDMTGDESLIRYWLWHSSSEIASDILYTQYANRMILVEPGSGTMLTISPFRRVWTCPWLYIRRRW
jgi:hypothetical protein